MTRMAPVRSLALALPMLVLLAPAAPRALGQAATAAKSPEAPEPAPAATGVLNFFLQTQSPLVNEKGLMEAVFLHRFNQPVNQAGGTNLFGLDSSANIGLGLEYVPVRNLATQVFRASTGGDYEFALKWTLLRPTASVPVAIGVRGGVDWITKGELEQRLGGFGQGLVSVTLGDRVTLSAAPTFVSNTPQQKKVFNVPVALQLKVTRSIAAIAEYVPRNRDLEGAVGQWSFGVAKSVLNHRFALVIGNCPGLTVDQRMAGDYGGGVRESNIRLGFNVIRNFDLATD